MSKEKTYKIGITMPSGEKLPTYIIDRDAFLLANAQDIGARLATDITQMIERRLRA